jgi:hypothetical protein
MFQWLYLTDNTTKVFHQEVTLQISVTLVRELTIPTH